MKKHPDIPNYEEYLSAPIEHSCEFCVHFKENNDNTFTCEKFNAKIEPNGHCPWHWEGTGIEPKP